MTTTHVCTILRLIGHFLGAHILTSSHQASGRLQNRVPLAISLEGQCFMGSQTSSNNAHLWCTSPRFPSLPRQTLLLSPQVRRFSSAVPGPLCLIGQRAGRSPVVAFLNDSLLSIWDRNSGRQFIVDIGPEVSILPATGLDTRTGQSGPLLTAANGSTIKMYGVHTIPLRFALRKYEWNFIIAEASAWWMQ